MAVYLTVNSEAISGRAFRCLDLSPLLGKSHRGSNRVLPGATGTRPLAGVVDEIDVALEWVVDGIYDYTNARHSDLTKGLALNIVHYKALFMDNGNATTGLVAATLTQPDATLSANIQCRSFDVAWNGGRYSTKVTTRIIVPAGVWT